METQAPRDALGRRVAGVVFATLTATAIVLVRTAPPSGVDGKEFVSTAFLGSGLIFAAALSGAAAAAWSVLDAGRQGASFGRDAASSRPHSSPSAICPA